MPNVRGRQSMKPIILIAWIFYTLPSLTQTPYGPFHDPGYCQAMRAWVESTGKATSPCLEVK